MNKFFKVEECLLTYNILEAEKLFCMTSFPVKEKEKSCYIEKIETKKGFRNLGYAKKCLKLFIEKMKERGDIDNIYLLAFYDQRYYDSYNENGLKELVDFYNSFDFKHIEDSHFSDQVDMKLKLK